MTFFPGLTLTHTQQPLTFQIQSCCNTSKAVLPRIGGEEAVSVEDNETTLSQLLARLESTIKILRSAKKDKFLAPVRCPLMLYVISLFPPSHEILFRNVIPKLTGSIFKNLGCQMRRQTRSTGSRIRRVGIYSEIRPSQLLLSYDDCI